MTKKTTLLFIVFIFVLFLIVGCQNTYEISNSTAKSLKKQMKNNFGSINSISITSDQPNISIIYKSVQEIDKDKKQKILLATIDYVMKDTRIEDLIHAKFKNKHKPDIVVEFISSQSTTKYEGNYNGKNSINEIKNYDIWDISKREEDIFFDYFSIINIPDLLNTNNTNKENIFIYKLRKLRRFDEAVLTIKSGESKESIVIKEDSVKNNILYELEHMTKLIEAESLNTNNYLYACVFDRSSERLFIYQTANGQYIKFKNTIFKIYEGGIDIEEFTKVLLND